MLVSKSKYERKCREFDVAIATIDIYKSRYIKLLGEWNNLVGRLNKNGLSKQFTQDEIRQLIQLCHPDKHDGKPLATAMTAKLLKLKEAL